MELEEIILEIENTNMKCKKQELIANSDYFKAMFEGNFLEKDRKTVKIEDVDIRTMNIILTLIWDTSYYIEDEDVLMVLEAACMLQFCKIRDMCLDKIKEILCPKNCLKIWIVTNLLDLRPISLKAYYLSLIEFMVIKDGEGIMELNLPQLKKYLGDTKLKTDNELSVFQTIMKWWYDHGDKCEHSDLLKLISCIDFKALSKDHFQEIHTYPDIANSDTGNILKCCYGIIHKNSIESFSKNCTTTTVLLSNTNRREVESFPCILANLKEAQVINKKSKVDGGEKVIFLDKFRRKRVYEKLDSTENENLHILFFDPNSGNFKKLITVKERLEGFKLLGYKEYVFMFGGEFVLGRGQWNLNFWCYDSLRERWERKTRSIARRHFQSCIVGSKVYIAGGTGLYRKNQENVLWYDFIEDKWSGEIPFPVFIRQLKCCDFMDKFFLVNINESCGYFLSNLGIWNAILIKLEDNLLDLQFEFSIFSYRNKIYIKGKKLIELSLVHNELLVSSIKNITNTNYDNMDSAVCNNFVYTLYKQNTDDNIKYSLESYDLETDDNKYIFRDLLENDVIQIDNEDFTIDPSLKVFAFSHYTLVENQKMVNYSF